ncbi:MAG: sodium-translocating pyrophosphatase [Patescibacteria group bacterium]
MVNFIQNNILQVLIIASGLSALIYALLNSRLILNQSEGNEKMKSIAAAISEGAVSYLKSQYIVVAVVAAVIFLILFKLFGALTATAFLLGGTASALASFLGMMVAVRSNARTAEKAREGLNSALRFAFKGGSVTGLLVAGFGILIVAAFYLLTKNMNALIALGFGGSLISVFARLGGGIYTKAADVGADLVGKVEKGIPEDDPRNPAVIADLVGDNVGDCAGMAADLFETYVATLVAAMLLTKLIIPQFEPAMLLPLAIGAISILSSILGTFFVRLPKSGYIMGALYKGLIAAAAITLILAYPLIAWVMNGNGLYSTANLYLSVVLGVLLTAGLVLLTEYYTSKGFPSVSSIADASQRGHGTNIIAGLAVSLKSTFAPVILISLTIWIAYALAGLYGIALAATAMLSLTGVVVAVDSFGPITDNAGGIAEMSGLPEDVRKVTDALDAVGNTTKAITKSYAIGSAALAAMVLFAAYTQEFATRGLRLDFSLNDPKVIIGLFLGASLPYLFAAFCMEAVGKAAGSIVEEVRRQFREIPGLMDGTGRPQYGQAVTIVTQAALKQMIIPALLPVVSPIVIAVLLGPIALGGLLLGVILTGLFLAISMTTGGAAWDNAKKYIEAGNYGGKGSFAHQAAVTGDTVGDPYKDTAGPAINPMIKVVNIVALLLAGFLI